MISGKQFGQGTYIKKDYVSLEFDNRLAFVNGKIITSALLAVGNIRTSELGYTVITVPIVADNVLYYGLIDPEGNFITRRKLTFEAGMEISTTTANAKTLHFKPDQTFVFSNTIKSGSDSSAQVFNLNPASTPGDCTGLDDPFAAVHTQQFSPDSSV